MKKNNYSINHIRCFICFFLLAFFSFQSNAYPAASSYFDTVQQIYIGYYQRPADPSGLIYWAGRLDSWGGNLNEIIEAFAHSAESQALYGTIDSTNIEIVVDAIYTALFGRVAEPVGKAFYVNGFNAGTFTPGTIVLNVLYGALNEDWQSVNNKLTAANLFTRTIDPELDGTNFQATYSGDGDAIEARNFLSLYATSVKLPTQSDTTAYIRTNIADPGDTIVTTTSIGTPFPIATTTSQEMGISVAFDGTNYLVGIQGDASDYTNITAQLVSQSGTLVGSRISVGRTGGAPSVAFDGTNYLMVWSDEGLPPYPPSPPNYLYGVFISKAGSVVNTPFLIDQGPLSDSEIGGIIFAGANYFVVYHKTDTTAGKDKVYGRFISPSGTIGSEITISSGYGNNGINNVAFDGANFFVVWNNHANNTEVKGRFVSQSGIPGTEITVKASGNPNDNPLSVAFDGANYLVVWTDQVSGNNWDVFGQLVTPAGALLGGVIIISTATGQQIAPGASFDGTNYLVSWVDMRNDINGNWVCDAGEGTCSDIYGQFVSKSGTLIGAEFTINNDAGNQIGGWLGQPANGKIFGLVNTGVNFSQEGINVDGGDVYGVFLDVSSTTNGGAISAESR